MAEQIEPGDRIVFYVTGVQAFGGIVRVTGEMYEDRSRSGPASRATRPLPWRFETEPELVLDEDAFVPAVELAGELEHVRKWPVEHWQLAFQGQLRAVPDADAELLERRIRGGARRGVSAGTAPVLAPRRRPRCCRGWTTCCERCAPPATGWRPEARAALEEAATVAGRARRVCQGWSCAVDARAARARDRAARPRAGWSTSRRCAMAEVTCAGRRASGSPLARAGRAGRPARMASRAPSAC